MGRRAKAFTLAEKKAQAQAKQYERRQTTQYVLSPITVIYFETYLIFLVRKQLYLHNAILRTGGLMADRDRLLCNIIYVCPTIWSRLQSKSSQFNHPFSELLRRVLKCWTRPGWATGMVGRHT